MTLDAATDPRETRVRLRQVIARTVERVTCVFVPGREEYGHARGRHVNQWRVERPAGWSVVPFVEAGLAEALDLRRPEHAARPGKAIAEIHIDPKKGEIKWVKSPRRNHSTRSSRR